MTDDIIKSCGCFATEACDHYERPGVLKHCPSCAAKDAELKAYKANSFCAFCAGKEEELKEQTRKSDVIIAAKDAAMWRKDREIDSLRARIEVLERFLADNADYDQMTEKDQEWFIENVHKKYYPENY